MITAGPLRNDRMVDFKYFECQIRRNGVFSKVVLPFKDAETAFAWLDADGYEVISIKEL